MEISFNFLRIHQIECTEKKVSFVMGVALGCHSIVYVPYVQTGFSYLQLTFNLAGDPRPRLFHSARADSVQIIGLITAQLKNVFPITQLE